MNAVTLISLVAFGVVTGVASGLLGVGGGIFMVPFLVLAIGVEQHEAAATSLVVVLPTAVAGALALRRRALLDLGRALRLGVLGATGAIGGAALALSVPADVLRVVFAVFLAIVGARIARDGVRMRRAATRVA